MRVLWSSRSIRSRRTWSPDRLRSRSPATTAICCSIIVRHGIKVLGIEPARNIARIAREHRGIDTIEEFFGRDLPHGLPPKAAAPT